MFLLNIYFIANRTTFNFEFLICHMTTWFNGHLVLRVGPLYFPSLGALGLDEEEILRFIFFVSPRKSSQTKSHVTPWVESFHETSPPFQVWWYWACRRGDIKFSTRKVTFSDQSRATCFWALLHHMSGSCKGWRPCIFWSKKYFVLSVSHDFMWPGGQGKMLLHGCLLFTLSRQLAKFHCHKPCQKGYVMLSICHLTTCHHILRESCDSTGGLLSP